MRLVNIYNKNRTVYVFERTEHGDLVVTEDDTMYPYYYEPDPAGLFVGYNGTKLRRCLCSRPADVKKNASPQAFSSDISFTKNYMIHKIGQIEKCPVKYFFLDIEILAKELPDVDRATQPITCISVYNSFNKELKTWWIKDYQGSINAAEDQLLSDFIQYTAKEQPDLWLSWNVSFDYTYLFNRVKAVKKKNFAEMISPIHESRLGHSDYEGVTFPAGISILDYLALFKKVFMREASYTLDAISQKYLKEEAWGDSDFGKLTDDIKDKNINDVIRLVKLEDQFKLIGYFNEIRVLTKTMWEELYHNSLIVESLLFQFAKEQNVILPNKPAKKTREEQEEEEGFEGATREAKRTGALYGINEFDLGSAYPNQIVNFCLDATNITEDFEEGTFIDGVIFKQNPDALLPTMVRKIMQLKDERGAELKKTEEGSSDRATAQIKYDAIKGVVNSAFGVMGFSSFRLFDNRVASSIAYLTRDLLMYAKDKMEAKGREAVYWDTDAIFLRSTEDHTDELNQVIQQWGKERYNKDSISIRFEYKGVFEKIYIIAKCRYYGYRVVPKSPKFPDGLKLEMKGVEAKRSNSTKYEGGFQKTLLDKLLNKKSKESVIAWIRSEKKKLRTLPLEQVSFPCKKSNKDYKVEPAYLRAFKNTCNIKNLDVPIGEVFWWVYVVPRGEDKNGKPINVVSFSAKDKAVVNRFDLDWDEIERRNINQKAMTIFEAQGWDSLPLTVSGGQQTLF